MSGGGELTAKLGPGLVVNVVGLVSDLASMFADLAVDLWMSVVSTKLMVRVVPPMPARSGPTCRSHW